MYLLVMLLSTLWILRRGCTAESYWTFVPAPPVIHPVTWDENIDIPVYNNQTTFLGPDSNRHIRPYHAVFNFSGKSDGFPVCFQKNKTIPECIQIEKTNDWDTNTTPGNHWAINMYYPQFINVTQGAGVFPPGIPPCNGRPSSSRIGLNWRLCHYNQITCFKVSDKGRFCDWNMIIQNKPINLISGIWTMNNVTFFTQLWKIIAAMGEIQATKINITWMETQQIWAMSSISNITRIYVTACVPDPYALVSGNLSKENDTITCINCSISNCINSTASSLLLVKQPDYIFIPVNLTQDWYADSSNEVLELVTKQLLSRSKRVIGMIIAGIAALITAITVTTIASISLSTSIQTASFVNSLSMNISQTFKIQEEWDEKIELKLNTLRDTVDLLGRQIQIISLKESMQCHAEYKAICVTPVKWNDTMFPWKKIQHHLQGIWDNANTSLDLQELRQHIQEMLNAQPIALPLAQKVHDFIEVLKSDFLSMQTFFHSIYSIIVLAIVIFIGVLACPFLIRCIGSQLKRTKIELKKVQLEMKKHESAPPLT